VLGHTGEPRELLALAEALYGRRPEAWLITLPAPELGFGEGLSATAEHGLAEALRQLRTLAGAFTAATGVILLHHVGNRIEDIGFLHAQSEPNRYS
jgi:hypothetical protein